ncbi:LapA family protein [Desulfurispira natronophila]|uniref:Putative integral membrane protein n=1 Tax=Desulfurispira natronophila TaxID=682562 RepID=A0A7W7Y5V3_9BACT|nr:LapA family protein [Desulfurispira natronophila]MBB5022479.1 putative integral membrane protein [Desulfurispira natronophila]
MDKLLDMKKVDASMLRRIGVAAAVIIAVVIVFQNIHSVDTRLLFITISMPHAIWSILLFAAGFLAGWLTKRQRVKSAEEEAEWTEEPQ